MFDALIDREAAGDALAADLTKRLLELRSLVDLGPAIYMDIARYLRRRIVLEPSAAEGKLLFEAFYSYLLPQFEGINPQRGERLFKILVQLIGVERRGQLASTLNAVLGLEITQSQRTDADTSLEDESEASSGAGESEPESGQPEAG